MDNPCYVTIVIQYREGDRHMPPRIQVTEERIIEKALEIVREQGIAALNARNLAKALGCSVQPIFRAFSNMEELKKKVIYCVADEYQQYLLKEMSMEDEMSGLLMAYIRFSQNEKNYFKLLHMSDRLGIQETAEFTETGVNKEIIMTIMQMTGLSKEDATTVYVGTFFATHGIASMIATNHCNFSDEVIQNIITNVFDGMVIKLKANKEM